MMFYKLMFADYQQKYIGSVVTEHCGMSNYEQIVANFGTFWIVFKFEF
jgi:hypothetical protein